jgi:hypothetical protein
MVLVSARFSHSSASVSNLITCVADRQYVEYDKLSKVLVHDFPKPHNQPVSSSLAQVVPTSEEELQPLTRPTSSVADVSADTSLSSFCLCAAASSSSGYEIETSSPTLSTLFAHSDSQKAKQAQTPAASAPAADPKKDDYAELLAYEELRAKHATREDFLGDIQKDPKV